MSKKHSVEVRTRAANLISKGYGEKTLAKELALSASIARKWIRSYRAVGREVFLEMGSSHRTYGFEVKQTAVLDFLEGRLSKSEVMVKHGIASATALDRWIREYRREGSDALRPKPKGRSRSETSSKPSPASREDALEAENRRLRAENAYLKKLRSLEAAKRAPGRSAR